MQFLLMIYSNEQDDAARSDDDNKAIFQAYTDFTAGIVKDGKFKAGDALLPTSAAQTVRVRDGKVITTDGPFAETREQLGGYYLVDAKDIDEACAIAAKIPTAKHGSVEVRPLMQWES